MKIKKTIAATLLALVPLAGIVLPVNAESESVLKAQLQQQVEEVNKLQNEIDEKESALKIAEAEQAKLKESIENAKEERQELEVQMNKVLQEEEQMLVFLQQNQSALSPEVLLAVGSEEEIKDAQSAKEGMNIIVGEFTRKIDVLIDKQDEIEYLTTKLQTEERESKRTIEVIKRDKESTTALLNQQNAKIDQLKAAIANKNLKPTGGTAVQAKSKTEIMKAAGIKESDYTHVNYIISRESGWRATAGNPYSGAYGLCQALPASKMASAGSDWRTNPVTQMKWCNSYAKGRYGSWTRAASFWKANHWW